MREPFSPRTHKYRWRRRIAANPVTNHTYRIVIGVLGALIVLGGLAAVPLPGPGWLIVFLGVGLWATEFMWAARLLTWGREKLDAWNKWLGGQPWWVKGLVGLGTLLIVLAALWASLRFGGIPSLLPDWLERWLAKIPGINH